MPSPPNRLRSIRYAHEFDEQMDGLRQQCDDPQRVDDVVDGVEWAVAVADDLEDVAITVDANVRVFYIVKTDPAPPCVPALRFLFTDAGDGLIDMHAVEPDPDYDLL